MDAAAAAAAAQLGDRLRYLVFGGSLVFSSVEILIVDMIWAWGFLRRKLSTNII